MTKVFKSSTISKILSTNKPNTIEVNNNNIIESDSEFREVIKKGYLLTQINLSTVPDVITDAINEAMFNTKEAVLSDALINTLKQSLENLDDGIYKKTYIDNTIAYLENLLTSKVNLETVASIADNKLAIALQGFATTSSVSTISSRVENSESEITNVKETINTKDTARATQIDELKVSIDDTFSGYSDAIDLYVDENGNLKSQKIERLELGNNMSRVSINESNEIVLDEEGNYTAITSKVILDSDGKIVGFKFTDTNAISTFKINTDVFEISNSTNSYTPFSIVGTDLLFNGKVTFSNITGGENIVTKQNVQDAINNNVTSINGGKIVTNEAFVNNLNAVGGIIAENISANEIVGKTITGSTLIGAVIQGAVIKASYLDLDGELEVLTNYHITVAMYNANPSLYTDAVYIEGNDEYRIPSISTVREDTKSVHITGIGNWYGKLESYNTANAGHNLKAVKIRPSFNNSQNFNIITSTSFVPMGYDPIGTVSNHFSLYLGGVALLTAHIQYLTVYVTRVTISGTYFTTIVKDLDNYYGMDGTSHGYNSLNLGFGVCSLSIIEHRTPENGGRDESSNPLIRVTVSVNLNTGEYLLPFNWTSNGIQFTQHIKPRTQAYANGYTNFNLNQSLQINNMI